MIIYMCSANNSQKKLPVQFFKYNGREYCLDPLKPKVLHISSDVRELIQKGVLLQSVSSDSLEPQLAQKLAEIQRQGFFQGRWPEITTNDRAVNQLSLLVSSACNLRCKYCYFTDEMHDSSTMLMTKEVANEAIDFLCAHSTKKRPIIHFFGGEPLLNFEVTKSVVKYCESKTQNFKFSITTNGVLVTESIATFLQEHDIETVVSLDGPQEIHNAARQFADGRHSYEAVMKGIETLKRFLPPEKLSINTVVTRNYPYMDKLLDFYEASGFSRVGFSTVTAPENSELHLNQKCMESIIDSENRIFSEILATTNPRKINYLPFRQYYRLLNSGKPQAFRCGVGRESLAVSPNGQLFPCHRFVDSQHCSLGDIWNGIDEPKRDVYYNLHEQVNASSCGDCWARFVCGGPCAYEAFLNSGSLSATNPEKCDRIRNLIAHSVIIFGELATQNREQLVEWLA